MLGCFFRGMLEVGLQPAVVKFSGEKSVTNGDPKGFLQFGANVALQTKQGKWPSYHEQEGRRGSDKWFWIVSE